MVFDDLWGWKRGEKMRHGTAHGNSKRGLWGYLLRAGWTDTIALYKAAHILSIALSLPLISNLISAAVGLNRMVQWAAKPHYVLNINSPHHLQGYSSPFPWDMARDITWKTSLNLCITREKIEMQLRKVTHRNSHHQRSRLASRHHFPLLHTYRTMHALVRLSLVQLACPVRQKTKAVFKGQWLTKRPLERSFHFSKWLFT